MNVYIDSNFVLELALKQQQAAAANQIMYWGDSGKISIVCPALVLTEPLSKMNYQRVERGRLALSLKQYSLQLARSGEHFTAVDKIEEVLHYFDALDGKESDETQRICRRLIERSRVLPLDVETMDLAHGIVRNYGTELTDALVLAAIFADLGRLRQAGRLSQSFFISRDTGFQKAKNELKEDLCTFIASFDNAAKAIQATLQS